MLLLYDDNMKLHILRLKASLQGIMRLQGKKETQATRKGHIMSTSCVLLVHDENKNELVRVYRHYDGYPSAMGQDIADILKIIADDDKLKKNWVLSLLSMLNNRCDFEVENHHLEHPDIDYIYRVYPILHEYGTVADFHIDAYATDCRLYKRVMADGPVYSGTPERFLEAIGIR